ncbi:MAG: sortase [Streptosporangiaceae bacterium]|nr:sortase [Streptosporangiaceae bacterium]MBV9856495.1 sortase [Streptosporangiaceae bacterium]
MTTEAPGKPPDGQRPLAATAPGSQDGAAKPAPGTRRPLDRDTIVRSVGVSLTLLAVVVLGFIGYLYFLSGVQEARAQTTLYAQLEGQLSQAIAPTGPSTAGPIAPGSPVAILNIPATGLHNEVVVEGTSPENLTLGPGHLRDTPLPGQAGISVLFGRRATFGGPFAQLPQVTPGAVVIVTTSQGTARYVVTTTADSARPVPFSSAPNQLLLVTADSSFAPAHYIEVAARLTTAPQPEPGGLPSVGTDEAALGRDFFALIPAMAWALALAATAIAGSIAAGRWARWPAWIATIPVVIAVTWNLYQSLTALLPNLY